MRKRGIKTLAKVLSLAMIVSVCNFGSLGVSAAKNQPVTSKPTTTTSSSTIYYNGTIITVDDEESIAEAVMVTDGKIVAVGDQDEILQMKTSTTTLVNLDGKTMLPGFMDSHSHLSMVSKYDDYTPTTGISSVDELVELCSENFDAWYATSVSEGTYEDGDWYIGNGYDNTTYPNAEHPTVADLDKVSTEVPIAIIHTSSHMAAVNSKALEILGYTKGSAMLDYFSEEIEVDADGNPTGIISEDAYFMLYYAPNILFDSTKTNTGSDEDNLQEAMELYASYGITTAQDAASSTIASTVESLLASGEELLIDINNYGTAAQMTSTTEDSTYEDGFRTIGVKYVVDGSPQAKTAWLLDPYYEVPEGKDEDYNGFATKTDEEVYDSIVECLENGYQIVAHTNGSAAIQQFLDQYEKALEDTGITDNLRPTLIHAQTITDEQLEKCAEIGMNISFFSDHVYYWGDYHLSSTLGEERANRISPIQAAVDLGINVTIHQDSPVVDPDMLFSIHTAVNRETRDGVVLGEEYAVDVMTAIKAVTINSAYQTFEEDTKGSIEVGKNADFVVLGENPLEVDSSTLKDINVLLTIKDDEVIYTSDDYSAPTELDSKALSFDVTTSNSGQAINQTYKISVNSGSLDLSKLKIVYTADSMANSKQNVWCDYAGVSFKTSPWYTNLTNKVKSSISGGTLTTTINSDTTIKAKNGEVTVNLRVSKQNWSKYSQIKKQSVLVYYDGILVKTI